GDDGQPLRAGSLHTCPGGFDRLGGAPHQRDLCAGTRHPLAERRTNSAATAANDGDSTLEGKDAEIAHRVLYLARLSGSGSITSRTAPRRWWYEEMNVRSVRTVAPYPSISESERPSGS